MSFFFVFPFFLLCLSIRHFLSSRATRGCARVLFSFCPLFLLYILLKSLFLFFTIHPLLSIFSSSCFLLSSFFLLSLRSSFFALLWSRLSHRPAFLTLALCFMISSSSDDRVLVPCFFGARKKSVLFLRTSLICRIPAFRDVRRQRNRFPAGAEPLSGAVLWQTLPPLSLCS